MHSLAHPAAAATHCANATAPLRVWLLRTSAWRPRWEELQQWLDASQRQRLSAIRDPQRRRDRLLAHALHRQVLGEALSLPPGHLPLFRCASGQPRLAIPGLHTSLSHADEVIAIALSRGAPVGVDVEMRATPSLQPIADLVCAPMELERLRCTPSSDAALLELWVRKEAALKAAGLGLSRPMSSFEAAEGARLRLRDAQGEPVHMQVRLIEAAVDCVVAVAGPPGCPARWQWLHPQD